ncbi:MAG TPA: tetratricopeptide repeat protein [Candidatus Acidoferrum sp.]|nr:tetratricopeptide repeat protein [Candidatus Acidoferrum sp.]
MGESPSTPSFANSPEDRLDSWKEIATHLDRDMTTVQRWEKREGMPVHRHLHDRSGSVYAFKSELNAWRQSRKPRLDEEKAQAVKPSASEDSDLGTTGARLARHWFVLGGVGTIVLLTLTYVFIKNRAGDPARPKIRSVAVLPLKNLSGDPTQEYLADGMTEALIGRLSGIHDLRVISRTSVMRFKDTQLLAPEIANTLGVDALVEGAIMREGNRIRVHAQLIRAATDEHFWSETYDRELRDVLALESDVAESIARKVEVTVTGEEHARLTAARSISPEVYESYLKGMFALNNKSRSRADVEESVGFFEEALKKDPAFAPAYVGLAHAHSELALVFRGAPPEPERAKVVSAAQKALELDPDLAEAHSLLAATQQERWQWTAAEAEYHRALELNPNDAQTHGRLATWLACQGRTDEALAWVKRGRELDPVTVSGTEVAWILFLARRYDEASQELHSVLAVRPDDAMALWFLGFVLNANSQSTEAIPVLEKAFSISGRGPAIIGVLVRAYAHAGRRTDALRLVAELKKRKQAGYVPAAAFVNAYLGLGDKEEAFAWLEQAYKEQSNILQWIKVHPYFDALRDDPRFKDLLRRVGLA